MPVIRSKPAPRDWRDFQRPRPEPVVIEVVEEIPGGVFERGRRYEVDSATADALIRLGYAVASGYFPEDGWVGLPDQPQVSRHGRKRRR